MRLFDRSIILYVENDILHKYSLLPRNRILKLGRSWDELIFENRENQHELIGALNIETISDAALNIKIENSIQNFFFFKKKNYIGNIETGLYSRGGILFSSSKPLPTKNFLCKVWNVFKEPTQYLNPKAIECISEAFIEYKQTPVTEFFSSCRIGKSLTEYTKSSVWIDQLRIVKRLGLEILGVGDVYSKSFYNYFFQEPFLGEKVDKQNSLHVKQLKDKTECTLLVEALISQVKKDLTQEDVALFKTTLSTSLLNEYERKNILWTEAQKYFFKFGIKDLNIDKELILYKFVYAPITELSKTIKNQDTYFLDFDQQFEVYWNLNFDSNFFKKTIKKVKSEKKPTRKRATNVKLKIEKHENLIEEINNIFEEKEQRVKKRRIEKKKEFLFRINSCK